MANVDLKTLFNDKSVPILNSVSNLTELNSISTTDLLVGAVCLVFDENSFYEWSGSEWVRYTIKDNTAATDDPTVNDDSSQGYSVLSRWYNAITEKVFVCVKANVGEAVWKQDSEIDIASLNETTGVEPSDLMLMQKSSGELVKAQVSTDLQNVFYNPTSLPSGTAAGTDTFSVVNGVTLQKRTFTEVSTFVQSEIGTKVSSVVAGSNITVDNTDPENPVVSTSSGPVSHGDIGLFDCKVDNVGTDPGSYATVKDAVDAGKRFLEVTANVSESSTLVLPNGVNLTIYVRAGITWTTQTINFNTPALLTTLRTICEPNASIILDTATNNNANCEHYHEGGSLSVSTSGWYVQKLMNWKNCNVNFENAAGPQLIGGNTSIFNNVEFVGAGTSQNFGFVSNGGQFDNIRFSGTWANNAYIFSKSGTSQSFVSNVLFNVFDDFIFQLQGTLNGWFSIGASSPTIQFSDDFSEDLQSPWNFISKTNADSPYTAKIKDFIKYDATSGNSVVNLPQAVFCKNKSILIRKIDATANTVTINPYSGDSIDGSNVLHTSSDYTCLISDGISTWTEISGF